MERKTQVVETKHLKPIKRSLVVRTIESLYLEGPLDNKSHDDILPYVRDGWKIARLDPYTGPQYKVWLEKLKDEKVTSLEVKETESKKEGVKKNPRKPANNRTKQKIAKRKVGTRRHHKNKQNK